MFTVEGVQRSGGSIKWSGLCKARAQARFDYCRASTVYVRVEITGPDGQIIARWKQSGTGNLD